MVDSSAAQLLGCSDSDVDVGVVVLVEILVEVVVEVLVMVLSVESVGEAGTPRVFENDVEVRERSSVSEEIKCVHDEILLEEFS